MPPRSMATRLLAAVVAPLLLAGCFLTPGKFNANLDLRRDGSFAFAYKGEVIFMAPDDMMGQNKPAKPWADSMAQCFKSGRTTTDEWGLSVTEAPAEATEGTGATEAKDAQSTEEAPDPDTTPRPCTAKELAKLKADYEAEQRSREEKRSKDAQNMAMLMGFGGDEASNRKFAAALMKYEGWKSVTYRGKGVFDVDYQYRGRIGHDYIFPVFPQSDLIIPFVITRTRPDGNVMVSAPALIGGGLKGLGARAKALGLPDSGKDMPNSPLTQGVFTITTDGEILTNNTEEGPVAMTSGRQLSWTIGPESERVPEALIKLR